MDPSTSRQDSRWELYVFALEDEAEHRRTRYAVVGAILVHAALFVAPLGFLDPGRVAAEPPPKKVFTVTPVRFEKTPPPPERLPQRRQIRVPVPDPTPHDPEPLRIDEEIPQRIAVPDIDIVSAIPAAPPPPEPAGPIRFGGDVTRPLKLSGPAPQYPEIDRRMRIEGVVIVEAVIDRAGGVRDVKVLRSLSRGLDQATVDAVRRWRFEPATLHGKPVDVYYNLTVRFVLDR